MPHVRSQHPAFKGFPVRLLGGLSLLCTILSLSAGHIPAAKAQTPAAVLSPGWNNVLYSGPPGPVDSVLSSLGNSLSAVLIWDAQGQRWHAYYPGATASGDLQTMLPGQAYWIDVLTASTLPAGIVSPDPAQILPGWNNVAYIGAGAPGSSLLEQNPLWTWDASSQKWLYRDPAKPSASDFQSLSVLHVYWLNYAPSGNQSPTGMSSAAGPATPPSPTAPTNGGCYGFTALQPPLGDVDDALSRAGVGALHLDPSLEPAYVRDGTAGSNAAMMPAYVPPTILRGIAWIESSWHQATFSTKSGLSGPTLASDGCAYGLMQIASGMAVSGTPTAKQQLIGTDFRANAEAAVQLLAGNWNRDPNALPALGRHDPHVLEDWYFAVWAYHCYGDPCTTYGVHDNPDDPSLPWPRPMFDSPDQRSGATSFTASDYPYEELVYGVINYPPAPSGQPLWPAIQALLPPHGAIGFPQAHAAAEASAHLDNGVALAAAPGPTQPATGAPQQIIPSLASPASN